MRACSILVLYLREPVILTISLRAAHHLPTPPSFCHCFGRLGVQVCGSPLSSVTLLGLSFPFPPHQPLSLASSWLLLPCRNLIPQYLNIVNCELKPFLPHLSLTHVADPLGSLRLLVVCQPILSSRPFQSCLDLADTLNFLSP